MSKTNTKSLVCAGIDIGKAKLDCAIAERGAELCCDNSQDGRGQLIAFLKGHGVRRVGLEASGGYEIEVVDDLRAAGFEVIMFQPNQVRAYGQFKRKRAKNDRIDAILIAECTAAQDGVRAAPDPRLAAFAEHLTWIEQIEEDVARAKVRRERYRNPRLKAEIEGEIKRLGARKREEIRLLLKALRAHADLAHKIELLVSIEGIGERTALALVVRMPELGTLSREEAACLIGAAPFVHEIGSLQGAAADRRREGARPNEPVRRCPGRRPPVEPSPDRLLRPPRQGRKAPHRRHRRLRQKNDHLRKRRPTKRPTMENHNGLIDPI